MFTKKSTIFFLDIFFLAYTDDKICDMIEKSGTKGYEPEYNDYQYGIDLNDCKEQCLRNPACKATEIKGDTCFIALHHIQEISYPGAVLAVKLCSGRPAEVSSPTLENPYDASSSHVLESSDEISSSILEKQDEVSSHGLENSDEISSSFVLEKTIEISSTFLGNQNKVSSLILDNQDEIASSFALQIDEEVSSCRVLENPDEVSSSIMIYPVSVYLSGSTQSQREKLKLSGLLISLATITGLVACAWISGLAWIVCSRRKQELSSHSRKLRLNTSRIFADSSPHSEMANSRTGARQMLPQTLPLKVYRIPRPLID